MNILNHPRYKDPYFTFANEGFKVVPDFENYRVSNYGRVLAAEREYETKYPEVKNRFNMRVITVFASDHGKAMVGLTKNGKTHNLQLTRIIAKAFGLGFKSYDREHFLDLDPGNLHSDNLFFGQGEELFAAWYKSRFGEEFNKALFAPGAYAKLKKQRKKETKAASLAFRKLLASRKTLSKAETIDALIMYYRDGLSLEEIAESLNKESDFFKKFLTKILVKKFE